MLLNDLIDHYRQHHPYGLRPSTVEQYRWAVHAWQRYAGRKLDTGTITADDVSAYLDAIRDTLSPHTVASRRAHLVALLRFARREGLSPALDLDRIRRVRKPRGVVVAWSPDEVRTLVAAARLLTAKHPCGTSMAAWWESLIRAAWDTGLRLGDLLSIERQWLLSDGQGGATLTIVQSKTGHQILCRLSPDTMASVDECWDAAPDRRLVWPLWGRRESVYYGFRRLVRSAGIRRGTSKWLRRGSVTSVERQQPGAGQRHAGHASPVTTYGYYIDASQLSPGPMPEPLGQVGK